MVGAKQRPCCLTVLGPQHWGLRQHTLDFVPPAGSLLLGHLPAWPACLQLLQSCLHQVHGASHPPPTGIRCRCGFVSSSSPSRYHSRGSLRSKTRGRELRACRSPTLSASASVTLTTATRPTTGLSHEPRGEDSPPWSEGRGPVRRFDHGSSEVRSSALCHLGAAVPRALATSTLSPFPPKPGSALLQHRHTHTGLTSSGSVEVRPQLCFSPAG